MADNKFYGATGLVGGTNGTLDDIDGAALVDGDGAVVITDGASYVYFLDDDSGAGEDSPNIIAPDNNAGTKRWILNDVLGGGGTTQLFPHNVTATPSGAWTGYSNANAFSRYYMRTAGYDNGDELNFSTYLSAGTYMVSMTTLRNTNCPIIDIYVDGVEKASFDLYGALNYSQIYKQQPISIPTSGVKTIRIVVDGKHASSTGYAFWFQVLSFQRMV